MYWALAHILKYLSCFVLGKCSVHPPHASIPAKENKWARKPGWISNDVSSWIFYSYILISSVDGVVNSMDSCFIIVCKPYGG